MLQFKDLIEMIARRSMAAWVALVCFVPFAALYNLAIGDSPKSH